MESQQAPALPKWIEDLEATLCVRQQLADALMAIARVTVDVYIERVLTPDERTRDLKPLKDSKDNLHVIQRLTKFRGWPTYKTVVEAAFSLESITQSKREWFARELDYRLPFADLAAQPVWNSDARTLKYCGSETRLAKNADSQTVILNEFQAEGWPHLVLAPTLFRKEGKRPKLSDVLFNLNRKSRSIGFEISKSGQQLTWRATANSGN